MASMSADLGTIQADIATVKADIDSKLPALGQSVMAGSVPVTISSDQSNIPITGMITGAIDSNLQVGDVDISYSNPIPISNVIVLSKAIATRPNDTPGAYSAKDEINSATDAITPFLTFENVVNVAGGSGIIFFAYKQTNDPASTAQLRLHVYSISPTAAGDHSSFVKRWVDRSKEIGYVDFSPPIVEGTGSDMAECKIEDLSIPFKCTSGSTSLYGRLECVAVGNAPIASQVYEITLGIME
jgi:hypothetical protein